MDRAKPFRSIECIISDLGAVYHPPRGCHVVHAKQTYFFSIDHVRYMSGKTDLGAVNHPPGSIRPRIQDAPASGQARVC